MEQSNRKHLIILSAHDRESLESYEKTVFDKLKEGNSPIDSAAWTLQTGRRELPFRKIMTLKSPEDISSPHFNMSNGSLSKKAVLKLADRMEDLKEISEGIYIGMGISGKYFEEERRNILPEFPKEIRRKLTSIKNEGTDDSDHLRCFTEQHAILKTLGKYFDLEGMIPEEEFKRKNSIGLLSYQCAVGRMSISEAVSQLKDMNKAFSEDFPQENVRNSDHLPVENPEEDGTLIISLTKNHGTLHEKIDESFFLETAGMAWLYGFEVNWSNFYEEIPYKTVLPGYRFRKTPLPSEITYPFMKNSSQGISSDGDKTRTETTVPSGKEEITDLNEVKEKLRNIWKEILGREDIRDRDNFMSLGGDSLNVAYMASMILKEFNVRLPLDSIYSDPVIGKISEKIYSSLNDKNHVNKEYMELKKAPPAEFYRLSSAQKRMYTAQYLERNSTSYNLGSFYEVEGKIDTQRLERAVERLTELHGSLRTSFELNNGEPVQKIHENVKGIYEEKWIGEDETPDIRALIKPFKLNEAPLFRVKLLKRTDESSFLFIDLHHIIGDQSSAAILLKEIEMLYKGEEPEKAEFTYTDYSEWHNSITDKGLVKESMDYWKKELSELPESLEIAPFMARPEKPDTKGKLVQYDLTEELTGRIREFSKGNGLTPYMVLTGAYNLLLSHYSGQRDLILGSAAAGRNTEGLSGIVGMFVNTLPLRFRFDPGDSLFEYLEKIKNTVINGFSNQEIPFDKILSELKPELNSSHSGLFGICINYVNMGTEELRLGDLKLTPVLNEEVDSKFDMTLTVVEKKDKFTLDVEFRTSVFEESFIDKFLKRFTVLTEEIVRINADNDIAAEDLNFIEEEELRMLEDLNKAGKYIPGEENIVDLFEKTVMENPQKEALTCANETLTYSELNNYANLFAHKLHERGIRKGDTAALYLNQGMEQIVAILAVIKMGAVYLPIDTEWPDERRNFMMEDGSAKIIVTNECHREKLKDYPYVVIDLETLRMEEKTHPPLAVRSPYTPSDLKGGDEMYIIYTSGSTGKPKGVVLKHQGVIRTVVNTNYYHIDREDNVTQMVSYTFDPSVMEIFGGLLNVAHLFIIPRNLLLDFPSFEKYLADMRITKAIFITPVFHLLAEYNPKALKGLKKVFIGGDALNPRSAGKVMEVIGPSNVVNLYGPTEATITATYCEVKKIKKDWLNVPIGKPISGAEVFVVNKELKRLPSGISGELVIAGPGIADGYLNRDELSREKFVELPFKDGRKGYRTGDRVYFDENMDLHFIGRIDSQVKIGGFRIEPDEIKNRIMEIPDVTEAFVRVNKDSNGERYLEAFIGIPGEKQNEFTPGKITEILKENLPSYMIPPKMKILDRIPLNTNGKIDRTKLGAVESTEKNPVVVPVGLPSGRNSEAQFPEIQFSENPPQNNSEGSEYMAPKTIQYISATDEILNSMRKILGDYTLLAEDDFFARGGQSLKAIALSQELGIKGFDVSVNDIFSKKTAEKIAEQFTGHTNSGKINAVNAGEIYAVNSEEDVPGKSEYRESLVGNRGSGVELNDVQLDLIIKNAVLSSENLAEFIGAGRTVKKLKYSPVQKFQSSAGENITGFVSDLKCSDGNELKRRLKNLIENQEMLRCVSNSEEMKMWDILDGTPVKSIPYDMIPLLDLRCYSEKTREKIVSGIFGKLLKNTDSDGIAWRTVFLREGESEFKVIFSFDHVIFDGTSKDIIKNCLSGGKPDSERSYSDYVDFLDMGPLCPDPLKELSLENWFSENSVLMKKTEEQSPGIPMKLTVRKKITGIEMNPLTEAYEIVGKLYSSSEDFEGTEKTGEKSFLPMLLVDAGRNFGATSFRGCVGEFLDLIPFIENGEKRGGFENYLKNVRDRRINFLWILEDPAGKDKYPELSDALFNLKDKTHNNILRCIVFNFQGYISKQQQNMFEENTERERDLISDIFISACYDNEELCLNILSRNGFSKDQLDLFPEGKAEIIRIR